MAELEFTILSDRNKKASRARWDANPADDPLVKQMMAVPAQPKTFDNDFLGG